MKKNASQGKDNGSCVQRTPPYRLVRSQDLANLGVFYVVIAQGYLYTLHLKNIIKIHGKLNDMLQQPKLQYKRNKEYKISEIEGIHQNPVVVYTWTVSLQTKTGNYH